MKRLIALLVVALLGIVPAFGQGSTGGIRGQVVDATGAAVVNATVTVSGPQLLGTKTAQTDNTGNYMILGLPPGTYDVDVKAAGFAVTREQGVQLRAGHTLTSNLALKVAAQATQVDVTARAEETPIVDSTTGVQRYNVSGEFLNKLPLSMRQNWDAVWFLLPGVVTMGRSGPDNNIDPQVHGASERSNIYKLDGFEIGNSFTNQGYTTQFSTELIQDVNIVTAGPDASQPLGQGGFINVVGKSGGNSFHGSASFYFQPKKWNWNNVPGGTTMDQRLYQPDASLGGPILKDRMWFFASYRRVQLDEGIPRAAATINTFNKYGIPIPDYDKIERNDRINVKVTTKVTDKHTLAVQLWNDQSKTLNSDSREQSAVESSISIASGGPAAQATWTANLLPNLLVTSTYGYRKSSSDTLGTGGTNPARVLYAPPLSVSGGLPTGASANLILYDGNRAGGGWYSKGNRNHSEFTSDAYYSRPELAGNHTFQFGIQWKPATKAYWDNLYTTPYVIHEVLGADGKTRIPFRQSTYTPDRLLGFNSTMGLLGGYLMDKWTPTPRLTLNLGVRFDRQISRDALGLDKMDAVSIDPRFGAAYSLSKEGKDVIRMSWARLHDVVYNQAAPSYAIGGTGTSNTLLYDNRRDGAGIPAPIGTLDSSQFTPASSTAALPLQFRNLDARAGHVDEFHIGYTREMPGKIALNAAWVRRKFSNDLVNVNVNLDIQNGVWMGYKDPKYTSISVATNNTWSYNIYNDFEISAVRNLGGKLQLFSSYTYQKQVQKGTWAPDSLYRYAQDPSWFENPFYNTRPHIVRINGSYYLPWRFTVAAIFSLQSGSASGAVMKYLPTGDPEIAAHGPQTRIINGVSVNNPFWSAARYAAPASYGQWRLPNMPRLNMRFGKEFKIAETHVLEGNVDVFNLTNNGAALFAYSGSTYINQSNQTENPNFKRFSASTQTPRGVQVSARYRF